MLRSRSKTKSARLKLPSGRADLSHTGTCGAMLRSTNRAAPKRIQSEGLRTNEVFDAIPALFRKGDRGRRIDVNEIIVEVLQSLRSELKVHEIENSLRTSRTASR